MRLTCSSRRYLPIQAADRTLSGPAVLQPLIPSRCGSYGGSCHPFYRQFQRLVHNTLHRISFERAFGGADATSAGAAVAAAATLFCGLLDVLFFRFYATTAPPAHRPLPVLRCVGAVRRGHFYTPTQTRHGGSHFPTPDPHPTTHRHPTRPHTHTHTYTPHHTHDWTGLHRRG